jgi:hypothetical protein
MIVPYIERYGKKIRIGDKVVASEIIRGPYYMVLPGHVFTYMGKDDCHNPGDILKDEETGLLVKQVSCLSFHLYEPDMETARQNYIDHIEKTKILEIINNNTCSQDVRMDGNHVCNLSGKPCKPDVSCIEYTTNKSEKILKFKRKIKMRKIQKDIKDGVQ